MDYDVFISCKSEDYKYAEIIYEYLKRNDISVFLASIELRQKGESEYIRAISQAMKSAYHLIVFASKAEYIDSTWVFYEWDMFLNAKLKGRKQGQILTILKDVDIDDINIDLWKYESFTFDSFKGKILSYVETPNSKLRKEQAKRKAQEEARTSNDLPKMGNKVYESQIFISYKRKDKEIVLRIKDVIERNTGISCWIDLDGIESDAQFANVIIDAINKCEIFLFMYSSAHSRITDYKNDWTVRELDFAQYKKKRVVFVNIDATELTDWFYLLFGTFQQVDATKSESIEKLIKDICVWLNINDKEQTRHTSTICNTIYQNRTKLFRIGKEVIKMIRVPKGSFIMGHIPQVDKLSLSSSSYPHKVEITQDFYICDTPVTQGLWYYIMGVQPSRFNYSDKAPVDSVSWDDCMEFICKLNNALGVEFRLPTEAEWEYAAKGGNTSHNFLYCGSNDIDEVAWCIKNSDGMTHEVALKKANELGIYDMSGNVWEWCSDFYSDNFSEKETDPQGPSLGTQHVYRGGCWCEDDDCCVVSRRQGLHNYRSFGGLGFRLAMSV